MLIGRKQSIQTNTPFRVYNRNCDDAVLKIFKYLLNSITDIHMYMSMYLIILHVLVNVQAIVLPQVYKYV